MALTSLAGKTAFITGGAKGIGLAIAKVVIARGGNVMLADIDTDALAAASEALGDQADSVLCDVADADAVKAAAEATIARFGKVHIVVNNAGVGANSVPGETALDDWRWVVDINLMGVVYGVETFVPLIKSHGEGGYIINTASMAGHAYGGGTGGPYTATKFAVVGYSEALRAELAPHDIGCSVLCPAWVSTDIHKSAFGAPSLAHVDLDMAMQSPGYKQMEAVITSGLSPDLVAEWSVDCMLANRFYIFTHPEFLDGIKQRFSALVRDYETAASDPRFQSGNSRALS